MVIRRFLVTLLLAALTATPAMADAFDHARVRLFFEQLPDGVHATVLVDSVWGATVDGDVRLTVNGQVVKVEPVLTNGSDAVSTWIAPAGVTIFACADLEGRAWTVGDQHRDVDERACGFRSSEAGPGPAPPRAPLAPPAARPVAGLVRNQR